MVVVGFPLPDSRQLRAGNDLGQGLDGSVVVAQADRLPMGEMI